MSSLRIGLVGAGWAAEQHTASLALLGEDAPVTVLDLDPDRARALAHRIGAGVSPDLDHLLGEGLDLAVVTTPAGAHAEAVVTLLRAGVAVFIEKPLAVSAHDAGAVLEAARVAGVPVAVGYQWRAVPALERLQRELAGQHIALLVSQGVGITQARSWFNDSALSGGLLGERGSHHLDLLRHLGGPVEQVRAVRGRVAVAGEQPAGAEDVVSITCVHTAGAVSMTALVWAAAEHLPEQSLRVVSSHGHYHLALDPAFSLTGRTGTVDLSASSAEVPFVRQLQRFLRAVRTGDPADVFCTPEQAAQTVAVAEAAAQALRTGETVSPA